MDASPNLEKKVIVSHCEAVQIISTTEAQVGRDDEGFANVAAFPVATLSQFPYPGVTSITCNRKQMSALR